MDLKSLNAPAIPVRQNRRTQLKPLSRLNGDWLPLLKKFRTSEMSQQVRGHNASEELRTRRLVEQWFGAVNWQLGKLQKAQGGAMADLSRLHLERRQLRRQMLLWRREEARQAAEREKEREARREEMEQVGREIERRTAQLQRESRRMSLRLTAALRRPSIRRGSLSAGDAAVEKEEAPKKEEPPPPLPFVPASLPPVREEPQAPPAPVRREGSNPMLAAKSLEVSRAGPGPLVRSRSRSDLSEEDPPADDPLELVVRTNRVLPPIPRLEESEDPPPGPAAAPAVAPAAAPAPRKRRNGAGSRCPFPAIAEDTDVDTAEAPAPATTGPRKSVGASTGPRTSPAGPAEARTSPSFRSGASKGPEGSASSPSSSSSGRAGPAGGAVAQNRERARRRAEQHRATLREPFTAYRRDSRGRLRALDQPPAPPKFEEPSNRATHRRSRLLRSERLGFEDKVRSLEEFTNGCVEEENRRLEELQAARTKPPPEMEKPRLDKEFEETRTMGPADWMRVFIHSSLPPGADPDDPDSLQHCRYLRQDADSDSDGENRPRPPRERISSWDPGF